MRWRFVGGLTRRRAARQRLLPFLERTRRRERWFKSAIVALTLLAVAGVVGSSRVGRWYARSFLTGARPLAAWLSGLEPDRALVEAHLAVRRARTVDATYQAVSRYYRDAPPTMQRLFRATGMDPAHALIGSGRVTDAFLLSPQVFVADTHGRSYRLRPGVRSVWLQQVTLRNGPFGLFLVRDDPEVRAAAGAAGAVVDEPSRQTTNSWGLRGPEPDPQAQVRGIVLGDSFMQGMFNGDHDTPPLALERTLRGLWGGSVSVLNTGHIGYAPEQYYHTLKEYGARFRPHFVVVSVCPNDFGPGADVMAGKGDDWDEAAWWLEQVAQWCRTRSVPCLLVPVPTDAQILGVRKDGRYPAPVCDLYRGVSSSYCDPLDAFVDEHLRLAREAVRQGAPLAKSPLYNGHIDDNHFSPAGAELWAGIVARRLDLLMGLRRSR